MYWKRILNANFEYNKTWNQAASFNFLYDNLMYLIFRIILR